MATVNRLVMEVNQGCARGYAFTLLQNVCNSYTGEYEEQPLDLTRYSVEFQVKLSPYFKIRPLIAKSITTDSDSATVGVITDPENGVFQVQLTQADTLKLPPRDYSLCIYLKELDCDVWTNISGEGNKFAIFRVCTM